MQETHKGHVLVTIGGESETFEPQRHKDIDAEQLTNLRRLLRKAGYGPGTGSVLGPRPRPTPLPPVEPTEATANPVMRTTR